MTFPIFNLFRRLNFSQEILHNSSSNKVSPLLPMECIQQIIEYLLQEKQGLYSSLLINRYWCKIVIPYLWKRPFELCSSKNRLKLFRTYLLCFDQEELDSLSIRMLDALYIFNIFPKKRNPLFDYFIFLQKVSSIEIEDIILPIYNKLAINKTSKISLEYRNEIPKFEKIIFHHIFKYSINLNQFNLDHWMKGEVVPIDEGNNNHLVYPGLYGINKFKIKNIGVMVGGKSELFEFISRFCMNMTCIEISLHTLDYLKENIIKIINNLIKSQKHLYEFSISHVSQINVIDPIMESLYSYQRKYLTTLSFTYVKFTEYSLNILVKLERLNDLSLIFCANVTKNILNQNLRLERLRILCVQSFHHMLLEILNVYGESLRVLDLNIHCKLFQKKIVALCPNIIELNINSSLI
ncbi:hypothetical protein C1645_811370 [Glomus cerebriforme]|uniref:F-box domain-containing protein n=1 Tax=Glomus cerebriforme TaxID=658196 RepID=A0A397TMY8_9GLOM|nr:hypothetical protein C1645_811370 [Glomus cerebriforme]